MTKQDKELTQMGILDCATKTNITDLDIKPADKLVLLAICAHIHKDISNGYYSSPSHAMITNEIGYKTRQISNSIAILVEMNYIKSVASKYSNKYYINAALIVEKHNLWRAAFKGEKPVDNPYKVVSSSAMEKFDKTENKVHSHVRDTSGFVQNQSGFKKQHCGMWYYTQESYNKAVADEMTDESDYPF